MIPHSSPSLARSVNRRILWKKILLHRYLYLMLLPCLAFFIVFSYIPMGGVILAFKEYKFNKGILGSPWIGFDYFKTFFQDYQSGLLIKNTLIISFLKLFVYLPFPILLALMFNELRRKWFKNVAQSISYLPHFLSWVVVVGMMQRVLAPDTGMLNQLTAFFGGAGDTFYMMESKYFYPIMFGSFIWKSIGWDSIIYLAAIAGVNPDMYEAAKIDGASKWREIWHITLPSIAPTIVTLFILSLGSVLSAGFDQLYLLGTPGNRALSDILDTYIIRIGLTSGQYGYATAVGLMQGLIGFILVIIANRLSRRLMDTSLW
ncbi:ABC transporter permease [Paenibacillus alginolyticus]|uniref:ABC transporter permease subunit n=1 Tax=Paenibacillus alginolyticus TaxID=59839 RepID=A0ABT4G610_9BACL|nr:ABC transporter permease subunit [Paenibacillus alginolyticus]MCY9691602.1 ABC transporter permease subunit [Paenibacillus alginolyticus]MEC0146962.1 ABC transporter permease subunit [Paenibacillus alginolyticus]